MKIFITILLSIEFLIISSQLGQDSNIILSAQKITTALIIGLFIFNAIVGLFCLIIKSNKKQGDYIAITMLFAIIFFIPINNFIIDNQTQNYVNKKTKTNRGATG